MAPPTWWVFSVVSFQPTKMLGGCRNQQLKRLFGPPWPCLFLRVLQAEIHFGGPKPKKGPANTFPLPGEQHLVAHAGAGADARDAKPPGDQLRARARGATGRQTACNRLAFACSWGMSRRVLGHRECSRPASEHAQIPPNPQA